MAGHTEFNRGKFKELVLHFAGEAQRAGDEGFGMVKLNKLLYRSDFEAFRLLGRSITGETYEKQEFGPVARDLPRVLDELAAQGRLRWQQIPRGERMRKVPSMAEDPDARADLRQFSDDERQIINRTLRELATYGGKSVSEWSHQESAGWRAVPRFGQEIDYGSAFIATPSIPREDLERARKYVRSRGWVH